MAKDKSFLNPKDFMEDEEFLISFNMALVCQRMYDEQSRNLKKYELTPRQGLVLAYLINHPHQNVTQTILEDHMRLSNPTITVIIQSMVKKGLISRERDPEDGRKYRLHPTEKGLKMIRDSRKYSLTLERAFYKDIPEEEMEMMKSVLSRIMDNLTKI